MDCPLGQKNVAVVERWLLVEVRLYNYYHYYYYYYRQGKVMDKTCIGGSFLKETKATRKNPVNLN